MSFYETKKPLVVRVTVFPLCAALTTHVLVSSDWACQIAQRGDAAMLLRFLVLQVRGLCPPPSHLPASFQRGTSPVLFL